MSPCHNLEPSLVARDSSRLLGVKPNEWMHLSPFYTRMHGEWLRYAKSTSQFHWRFLLVRDVRGFQVNPLCRHDITSPFPPSGNGGYVRNLDVHPPHQYKQQIHTDIQFHCILPMQYEVLYQSFYFSRNHILLLNAPPEVVQLPIVRKNIFSICYWCSDQKKDSLNSQAHFLHYTLALHSRSDF